MDKDDKIREEILQAFRIPKKLLDQCKSSSSVTAELQLDKFNKSIHIN